MFYGYGVFCAVERDPEYFEIATSRIAVASPLPPENGFDIGCVGVVDGVYAERRFVSVAGSDGWYRAYGCG
jgi:hypothetical protein